jgi:hypothetical protein
MLRKRLLDSLRLDGKVSSCCGWRMTPELFRNWQSPRARLGISLSALLELLLPPPPFSSFRAERLQSFKFLNQFS